MSSTTTTRSAPPRRLDVTTLRAGASLEHALFTRQGVMLLSSGMILSPTLIDALREIGHAELFVAESADDLGRAGLLKTDVPDELLARDRSQAARIRSIIRQVMTPRRKQADDVFEFLPVDTDDPQGARRERAARLKRTESILDHHRRSWTRVQPRIARNVRPFAPVDASINDWSSDDERAELRHALHDRCVPHFANVAAGLGDDLAVVLESVDELIRRYKLAPHRFAQLLIADSNEVPELTEHATGVAMLSVAMALRLGWATDDVRRAGLVGLYCDVGMVMVPRSIREARSPLDDTGVNRVARHPATSVVLLDAVDDLPPSVSLGVYQHHERLNGAGYPEGAMNQAVSDLARLVRVADSYLAQISARPHRPAHRPYDALEDLILNAARNEFDRPSVRALVEVVGLYPLGSHVRLSDGSVNEVIGVDPEQPDRPIVRDDAGVERVLGGVSRDTLQIDAIVDPPMVRSSRRAG